ncbi:hypothetical protein ACB092_06G056000, partial [Castanea dentata]
DRISNLPDSLLCHILSFLPTKEAPLWTLVPTLDFKDSPCKNIVSFTYIVYRILALRIAPLLRNFTLAWYSLCDSFHLYTWIHAALVRNVEQLNLEIYLNGNDNYNGRRFKLPRSVYSCKTVVVMELTGGILLDPPPSFRFPSLKNLRLCKFFYRYEDSMSRLFTGCPVLNDLAVLRDGVDGMTNFNTSIPKLKRLSIHFNSYKYPNTPGYKLEIYTPALEYFEFCGDLHNVVFLEKLANLVEAHADIRAVEGPHMRWVCDNKIYCGDRIFKLLRALNNTKLFSLYPGDKEHYHNSEEKLCWTEPPHDAGYLSSHLTTFYFEGFEGLEHEVDFVKYILKEARVLKKIKINVTDRQSKESVLEKLSRFPRHSTTCLLIVE